MLLVGRPLPVGDTYRAFSGFMHVPHGHSDAMLAAIDSGDSDAVADALAAILAPPRLANTDGHDLIAHTITWRVPDPSLVGDALVAAGLQADNDGWTLVRNSTNQDNTVIAGVDLDGDELTVEVNSAERAAELQVLVAAALPDAELVDVDARPFEVPADGPVRPPARVASTSTIRRSAPCWPITSPAWSGGGWTSRSPPSAGARHARPPTIRSAARS